MSVVDRLFGWNLVTLSLFVDRGSAGASINGNPLANLITVFQDCHLRTDDNDVEGRATNEVWDHPLPISSHWSVDVGAVIDSSLPTLLEVRVRYGRGPFWAAIQHLSETGFTTQYYGRVLISQPGIHFATEAATQEGALKGQGALYTGFISV